MGCGVFSAAEKTDSCSYGGLLVCVLEQKRQNVTVMVDFWFVLEQKRQAVTVMVHGLLVCLQLQKVTTTLDFCCAFSGKKDRPEV